MTAKSGLDRRKAIADWIVMMMISLVAIGVRAEMFSIAILIGIAILVAIASKIVAK